jgi:hypothetical protein
VKIEDLSLRQVAIVVPILGFLNWAVFQFLILPPMPEEQRQRLYAGWASTPYPYAVSLAFILFAAWFVFFYRGRVSTHGRRIAVFAMAFGALCGMLMIFAIRTVWHI